MANVKRNGGSATSRIAVKEIPAPSGKENARPNERRIAARRKLSFTGCEAPRRSRVSLAAREERKEEPTTTLFGQTFAVKKTPFHVHCDERNVPGPATRPRASKVAHRQHQVQTREVEGSGKVAEKRLPVRSGSVRGGSCPSEQPRDCQETRPSKIPRRSRCTSVPPRENASTVTRRAASVENAFGSTTTANGTKIGRAPTPRTDCIRGETIKGRLAHAAIVAPRRNGRTVELSRNVSTPVDGAPPPPGPKIPLKAALRAVAKSKTVEPDRAEARAKEIDPFPTESVYLAEYNEYMALVELEREQRSPRLSDRFLSERINAEQRRLVVAFLIRLGTHCRYPSSVVYQSVKLFDVAMDRIRVETRFIQLTALASLWISLKRQENFHRIPSATTMVKLANELYAGREDLLIAYERAILCELNFDVTFADTYTLFAHHLINCGRCVNAFEDTISNLYKCGCYAIDVTLVDEQFCRTSAGLVAATVAELVFGLVFDTVSPGPINPRWLFWRGLLFAAVPGLSGRFQDKEIDRTRVAILRRLSNSGKKHDGFEVVYRKYNRSKYGRVSDLLLKRVLGMAAAETLFDP